MNNLKQLLAKMADLKYPEDDVITLSEARLLVKEIDRLNHVIEELGLSLEHSQEETRNLQTLAHIRGYGY